MKILYWIPKNLLSYWVGKFMYLKFPRPLAQWLINTFAKRYRIHIEEAENPLSAYASIGDFFTRRLKEGVRPLGDSAYVHPADSVITARGRISKAQLIQAKGRMYSLEKFLGVSSVAEWENGFFVTYYLCPTDYHRVHSPIDAWVKEVKYIPGALWPVNEWSVNTIDELFVQNERVVVELESSRGALALVFVGATNVGSIRLTLEPSLKTNHAHVRSAQTWRYSPHQMKIEKGQELGMFCMGSTVIVVAKDSWSELIPLVQEVKPKKVKVRSSLESEL